MSVKDEQREVCAREVDTALHHLKQEHSLDKQKAIEEATNQLKQEHLLDKRKAVEEAVQFVEKQRRQGSEQVELGQQKTGRRRRHAHLMEQWHQNSQGLQRDQQHQFEPVNQQQKQHSQQQSDLELHQQQRYIQPQKQDSEGLQQQRAVPDQQPQQQSEQQQYEPVNQQQKQHSQQQSDKDLELHQQQRYIQPQEQDNEGLQQQRAVPDQQPQEQLEQQQQNSHVDRQQLRRVVQQQVPVQLPSNELNPQQQDENRPPELSSQHDDKHVVQQNKGDPQHPQQIALVVAEAKQKTTDEQSQMVNQQSASQGPQSSGLNNLQKQQPDQQLRQELIYQVPVPLHVRGYKQPADEQVIKNDMQLPRPEWKQRLMDVNRQQQFEQLQQDNLREHMQSQKGWFFFNRFVVKL